MAETTTGAKFVDLAQLSLSGSLVPSVPTQLMIKFNPPKMTIVYHFEQRSNDQYYHDIFFDLDMLVSKSTEDIVSHLYVTEAYYFNPKQVKRAQLVRLVEMIQKNLKKSGALEGSSPGGTNELRDKEQRRRNYFERKRWLNYPQHNVGENAHPNGQENDQRNSPPMEQRSGATNPNALNQRRRFDDLRI